MLVMRHKLETIGQNPVFHFSLLVGSHCTMYPVINYAYPQYKSICVFENTISTSGDWVRLNPEIIDLLSLICNPEMVHACIRVWGHEYSIHNMEGKLNRYCYVHIRYTNIHENIAMGQRNNVDWDIHNTSSTIVDMNGIVIASCAQPKKQSEKWIVKWFELDKKLVTNS